ncbi:hypothetical protein SAMN05216421_2151 [Halopseudomonas xinjiangensis]|uniref:Uncharacterized protein n=1 Tax=Halopseudomonas xinjiangensis TaxID=487184 RepID=A0A1H1UVL7_9GAMM|nr:hypothetical protein [Halopseudomonas xinjiangensis]SDS76614.1 hypothetical protein SAMN05216421_2151 [Halopseudomonas xinjiangensis]
MPLFEIVFQGQVKTGVAAEQARARLGQLFQAGEQQLDTLFSGRRIVIKQGLDAAAAERYRQAIDRAGAVCLVEPMESVAQDPTREPEAPAPAPTSSATAGARVVPRDEYMAAFSNVQAPDFGIAELGADLQDEYVDHTPLPLDLSALSLAPPGADLDQIKPDTAPVSPNIGHLKLVE